MLITTLLTACGGGSRGGNDTTNNDTTNNDDGVLEVPSKYSTIQEAINAAGVGAIIKVAAGTYNENIKVKDKITIEGAGPGVTLIKGLGTAAVVSENIVADFAEGVTIKGVSIENGTKGIELFHVIMKISDCVIKNNSGDGLYLSSSPTTISNCRISTNSGDGINAYSSSVNVSNTIVNSNAGSGITLLSSPLNLSYSTINSNSGHGIKAYSSTGSIENSIISNHNKSNKDGISELSSSMYQNHLNFWNNDCNWSQDSTCYIGKAYYDIINSILSDPLFVSATDFHLQGGSPALIGSASGGQIGAYGNGGNPPD